MSDMVFDASLFVRPPVLNVLSGIALSQALVAASPKDMPVAVRKSAQKLDGVGKAAQAAWAARQRDLAPTTEEGSRGLDVQADRAWAALRDRLLAYALLPPDEYPKAGRAKELGGALFPEGLEFTQYTYPEQFAAMDTLLQRIEQEHLDKELEALCGADFLANIRRLHPRYRAMVQASLARSGSGENLSNHVRAIGQAIVEYATRVAATVDGDEPSSIERALAALAPLTNFREQAARRAGPAAAEPPAPPSPTPAADPATPA